MAQSDRPKDRPDRLAVVGRWLTVLLAIVGVAAGFGVAIAPTEVPTTTITWTGAPEEGDGSDVDPASPGPRVATLLLSNVFPQRLDVRLPASAVADGVDREILTTTAPENSASIEAPGLRVSSEAGTLQIAVGQDVLYRAPVPTGSTGFFQSVFTDGNLEVTDPVGEITHISLPQMPLVTSLRTDADYSSAGLLVSVEAFNAAEAQATTTKQALQIVTGAAVLLSLALLCIRVVRRRQRRGGRHGAHGDRRHRRGAGVVVVSAVVSVAVVGVMVFWYFVAPVGDDDSWIMVMARHFADQGFVGEYYWLANASHTPFDWWWKALWAWMSLGDSSIAWMRIPTLVASVAAWFVLQSTASLLPDDKRWARVWYRFLLAVAFLAWWLPYGMTLRVEAVQPLLSALTAVLALRYVLGRSKGPEGLAVAVAVASVALVTHPNGFTAWAPLLAALPTFVADVRAQGRGGRIALVAQTLAPVALIPLIGFSSGSLATMRLSTEQYAAVGRSQYWYDEWQRYAQLLGDGTLGAYARRMAVLLGLFLLIVYAVSRLPHVRPHLAVSRQVRFLAATLGLAFVALGFVPSKFTHHFGSLASLGALFIASLLIYWWLNLAEETRVGSWRVAIIPLGVFGVGVLSFSGENSWWGPYNVGLGQVGQVLHIGALALNSQVLWLALVLFSLLVGLALVWRRGRPLGAAVFRPALALGGTVSIVVALAMLIGVVLGSWGLSLLRSPDGWSQARDNVGVLDGGSVGATEELLVWPMESASPLPVARADESLSTAFLEGQPGDPAVPVRQSSKAGALAGAIGTWTGERDAAVGTAVRDWQRLPQSLQQDERLLVAYAGSVLPGNTLEVEFGDLDGPGSEPEMITSMVVGDGSASKAWRTAAIMPSSIPPGADVVRVRTTSLGGGPGQWVASSVVSVGESVPLRRFVGDGAGVGVSWINALAYPDLSNISLADGVVETPRILITSGPDGINRDYSVEFDRVSGGVFAGAHAEAGIEVLSAEMPADPLSRQTVQVLTYQDNSTLHRTTELREQSGWRTIPWSWPPVPGANQ